MELKTDGIFKKPMNFMRWVDGAVVRKVGVTYFSIGHYDSNGVSSVETHLHQNCGIQRFWYLWVVLEWNPISPRLYVQPTCTCKSARLPVQPDAV